MEFRPSESQSRGFIGTTLRSAAGNHKSFCIVHVIKSNRARVREGEGVGLLPSNTKSLPWDRLCFVVLRNCGLTPFLNPFSYHYCTVTTCKKWKPCSIEVLHIDITQIQTSLTNCFLKQHVICTTLLCFVLGVSGLLIKVDMALIRSSKSKWFTLERL